MVTLWIDAPQAVKLARRAPVSNLTDEEKANAFLEFKDNMVGPSRNGQGYNLNETGILQLCSWTKRRILFAAWWN